MKIAFDITTLVEAAKTGIGNYTYNLAKNLLRIDNENEYFFLGITPLKAVNYIKNLDFLDNENAVLKLYRLPSKLFHRIFSIWQKTKFPPAEWLTGPVDLFHSFDWFFPPVDRSRAIATIFDLTPLTHPQWHTRGNIQQHSQRLKAIQQRADFIITISKQIKKDINKLLNIDSGKIAVVYPGIDKKRFTFIKKRMEVNNVLKKYGLKPGYLLFVGTLQPRKNVNHLIKAYRLLQSRNNLKKKLVLVGRKGKEAEKLDYGKGVVSTGYIPEKDLPFIYNGADLFVYPSLYEGFGMPVLEAMACGCPVLASNNNSGLLEAAGKGTALVDPYKTEEIARLINEILTNKRFKKSLIERGFQQVKKFSWQKSAQKTLEIYKTLIK